MKPSPVRLCLCLLVCLSFVLPGCASQQKAKAANGEEVHVKGASRERCFHWILGERATKARWRLLIDELYAEPEQHLDHAIENASNRLSSWPDELRKVPPYWHPEDAESTPKIGSIMRHLDGRILPKTWSKFRASKSLPMLTKITIANRDQMFTFLEEIEQDPKAYPNVRSLRLYRLHRSARLLIRLMRSPWFARITTFELSRPFLVDELDEIMDSPYAKNIKHLTSWGVYDRSPARRQLVLQKMADRKWLASFESLTFQRARWRLGEFDLLVAALGKPKKLRYLDMSYNYLQDAQIEKLMKVQGLYELKTLKIGGNRLTLKGFQAMSRARDMHYLEHLEMQAMNMTDESAAWVGRSRIVTRLKYLDISFNRLTARGFAEFVANKRTTGPLKTLRASGNALGPQAGRILAHGKAMETLERLDLKNASLQDGGATALFTQTKSTGLKFLDLDRNGMTANAMKALQKAPFAPNLLRLSLSYNGIGDEGIKALVQIPMYLREAAFDGIQLGDGGLGPLMKSQAMRLVETLTMRSNKWTHEGAKAFGRVPPLERLTTLDVRGNWLGTVENLLVLAWSPVALHLHRPRLSFRKIDTGVEDVEEMFDDEKVEVKGMSALMQFANVPQMVQKFVNSPYLSASMRRDLAYVLVRSLKELEKPKVKEAVPTAVLLFAGNYINGLKDLNDSRRSLIASANKSEDAILRWGKGWLRDW